MQPAQIEVRGRGDAAHRLLGVAGGDRHAELAVEDAGRRLLVRVGVDAGRDAQQHRLAHARPGRRLLDQLDLSEVVDHDAADAGLDGRAQFLGRLVVAVQVDRRGVDTGGEHDRQLSAGDGVEAVALGGDQAGEGAVEERLGGVEGGCLLVLLAERIEEAARLPLQRREVVDVKRGAVLARERGQLAAADGERARPAEAGGDGQEMRQRQRCRRGGSHGVPRSRGVVLFGLASGAPAGAWGARARLDVTRRLFARIIARPPPHRTAGGWYWVR